MFIHRSVSTVLRRLKMYHCQFALMLCHNTDWDNNSWCNLDKVRGRSYLKVRHHFFMTVVVGFCSCFIAVVIYYKSVREWQRGIFYIYNYTMVKVRLFCWCCCVCCIILLTLCFLFVCFHEPAMTTTKLPLAGWLKFFELNWIYALIMWKVDYLYIFF